MDNKKGTFHEDLYTFRTISLLVPLRINFHSTWTTKNGTFHEDLYTFRIISLPFPLRTINVLDKRVVEKIKTHFVFRNTFFFKYTDVYDIMWETSLERDRPQITTRLTRIARWVPKATNTHPQYVIIIIFPRPR